MTEDERSEELRHALQAVEEAREMLNNREGIADIDDVGEWAMWIEQKLDGVISGLSVVLGLPDPWLRALARQGRHLTLVQPPNPNWDDPNHPDYIPF